MGQHKHNPNCELAKKGLLPPKPKKKKMSKRESDRLLMRKIREITGASMVERIMGRSYKQIAEKIIDTAALIDQLRILLWDRSKSREELAELVIKAVDEAGQEFVRCKDCRWRETYGCFYCRQRHECSPREDNDYCSDGERRDSE